MRGCVCGGVINDRHPGAPHVFVDRLRRRRIDHAPVKDIPGLDPNLPTDTDALNIKYAETFVDLAKVNLQKATDFNRRVPGAFSEAEVDRLRRLVAFGEERLGWTKSAGHKQSDANIFAAEVSLRSAEANHQKAMSANTRVPGAVSNLEIERLRLTADLARMSMQKARLVAETATPVGRRAVELDQLREDVMQLRSRVEAITARR